MQAKAFISGCQSTRLTPEERSFFEIEKPVGLILFARNVETPEQVSELTREFREIVGRSDAPILIDQEGGRVQRLKPPVWPSYPASGTWSALYKQDQEAALRGVYLTSMLMGVDLAKIGVSVSCLPVLDLYFDFASKVVGDRAYSDDPEAVAHMGRKAIEGCLAAGILPIIKHIPGHGRALADSHLELPVVETKLEELRQTDFVPFKALADCSMGMTAHIVFSDIDSEHPATQSAVVIEQIIRGEIGFAGCLFSDDLSMKALKGEMDERTRKVYEAGCDVALHCNGELNEMQQVASVAPLLAGKAKERLEVALAGVSPRAIDATLEKELRDELDALVNRAKEL
ncbi:beta-N-acetylhexosaminidase [Rhodobacteraceae bacterium RKSG542]|uniref:beta-N-acetylhexosaminidase n=1 Tax=Pseudovibrio flavus TaxID=2529854 RepID=UPI0012BC4413|nr:beta-N-acetylhexosaminidase [Pseudovibrio flavus]MTI15858.1 beta-N-acetylhexosaminidase [Pseudovibrio flavus]